jgi:molybdopterin-biosynthesis enzyme MoeA-like protein
MGRPILARSPSYTNGVKTSGAEMNDARLRLTRIPKDVDLILNKVSGAPGFWIGNVIVMAVVPSIMQAMLDEVAPKLKIGIPMLSETVRADARERQHRDATRRDRQSQSRGRDRELSVLRSAARAQYDVVLRARDAQKLVQAKRVVEDILERVRRAQSSS